MLRHSYPFIPNSADDLHCFQAAVRMTWAGIFGETLDEAQADTLTEFVAGEQTWPFAGMLAMAEAGATVVNIENFNPEAFAQDPRGELMRTSDGDTALVDHVFMVSDVEAQRDRVSACLAHPRITFLVRVPSPDELLCNVRQPQTAVVCNINYRVLAGLDGYNGHFVLVDEVVDRDHVRIQDPGPPPLEDHVVHIDDFVAAWASPHPKLANLLVVSNG